MGGPFFEAVVGHEVLDHVGGGHFEGTVEGGLELGLGTDADDGVGRFDAGAGELGVLANGNGELDVHGGFDAIAGGFAVALQGVAVTQEEHGAGVVDGEENGGAFADAVVIEVAAIGSGGTGGGGPIAGGGDADAAEHGFGGELHGDGFAAGFAEADEVVDAVEIPGDVVGEAFADEVAFVDGRVGFFDVVRRHGEEAEAVAGVAPVAVEADFVEGDGDGVTGLGAFDVEGPGERVGAVGDGVAEVVLAAGIEGAGGDALGGFDALFDGVFMEEGAVVGFGLGVEGEGEEEQETHWGIIAGGGAG